jgi:flagellar protein FliL
MPTEQRVIASKPKIGARPAPAAAPPEETASAGGGGKKKMMLVVLLVVLLGGGAGYWFVLGPGAGKEAAAEEVVEPGTAEPTGKPGKVLTTEPISINLAGGHYLRLGLGLQLSETAYKPDGAAAVDAAITLFSGRSVTEVNSPEGREALKEELRHSVWKLYKGDVLDVYFTDYVSQ